MEITYVDTMDHCHFDGASSLLNASILDKCDPLRPGPHEQRVSQLRTLIDRTPDGLDVPEDFVFEHEEHQEND